MGNAIFTDWIWHHSGNFQTTKFVWFKGNACRKSFVCFFFGDFPTTNLEVQSLRIQKPGAFRHHGVTKQNDQMQQLYPLLHWNSYGHWPIWFDLPVKTGQFPKLGSFMLVWRVDPITVMPNVWVYWVEIHRSKLCGFVFGGTRGWSISESH